MVARALLRAASPLSRKPSRRSHQRARFSRSSVGECPNEFTRKQWRKRPRLRSAGVGKPGGLPYCLPRLTGQMYDLKALPSCRFHLGPGSGAFWPSRRAQQRWLVVGTPRQASARVPVPRVRLCTNPEVSRRPDLWHRHSACVLEKWMNSMHRHECVRHQ